MSRRISPSSRTIRSAYASMRRPAGVSVAERVLRSNRRTSNASSSDAMRLDTAACVVWSFSAVSRKFSSFASQTKVSRNRMFIEVET